MFLWGFCNYCLMKNTKYLNTVVVSIVSLTDLLVFWEMGREVNAFHQLQKSILVN